MWDHEDRARRPARARRAASGVLESGAPDAGLDGARRRVGRDARAALGVGPPVILALALGALFAMLLLEHWVDGGRLRAAVAALVAARGGTGAEAATGRAPARRLAARSDGVGDGAVHLHARAPCSASLIGVVLLPALPRHALAAAGHRRTRRSRCRRSLTGVLAAVEPCRSWPRRGAARAGVPRSRAWLLALALRRAARLPGRPGPRVPAATSWTSSPTRQRLRIDRTSRSSPCTTRTSLVGILLTRALLAARQGDHALPGDRAAGDLVLLVLRRAGRGARRTHPDLAVAMTDRRASLLMWIGVWAAPVAWAVQHAAG